MFSIIYLYTPIDPANDLILANIGAITRNFFSLLNAHNPNGTFDNNKILKQRSVITG